MSAQTNGMSPFTLPQFRWMEKRLSVATGAPAAAIGKLLDEPESSEAVLEFLNNPSVLSIFVNGFQGNDVVALKASLRPPSTEEGKFIYFVKTNVKGFHAGSNIRETVVSSCGLRRLSFHLLKCDSLLC